MQQIGGFEIGVNPAHPPRDLEISMGGDSGSVWLIDTSGADKDVAVGLHFAGESDPNPAEEHAVACDIGSVLAKLEISLRNPAAATSENAKPSAPRRAVRSAAA